MQRNVADPVFLPGAEVQGLQRTGHKRRNDSPTPEGDGAENAQPPPRKRHRLGTSSAEVEVPAAQPEGAASAEAGSRAEAHASEAGGELLSNGDVAAHEGGVERVAAPVQASGSAAAEPAQHLEEAPHAPGRSMHVGGLAELEGKGMALGSQPAADADASMDAVGSEAAETPPQDQETQQQQQAGDKGTTGGPWKEDAVPSADGAAAKVVSAPEPFVAADVTLDDISRLAEGQVEASAAGSAALDDMPRPAEGQVEGLPDNNAPGLEHTSPKIA